MTGDTITLRQSTTRELAIFLVLFLVGIAVLPFCVYLVGFAMFGEYGGTGFSAFFAAIHAGLRDGDPATWFLVLSPYLGWQVLRIALRIFRRLGRP